MDLDHEAWTAAGFNILVRNSGLHVIMHSPEDQLCIHVEMWPTSYDDEGKQKWLIYGKTFHAWPDTVLRNILNGRIRLPEDASGGTCSSCGAAVTWVKTSRGKMMPLNKTGESHFATCPNADRHRRS